MIRFVARRLLEAIPLVLGVVLVLFILLELAPGDPIQAMVGDFPVSAAFEAEVRENFGLDRPAPQRFMAYVGNLFTGDLGYSYSNRQPVLGLILERMVNTLILSISGLVLAAVLGTLAGIAAATTRKRSIDSGITIASLAGFSIPVFWLGQILIITLALGLELFPVQGMRSIRENYEGWAAVGDVSWHLVLPMIAVMARPLGQISRITRASMLESLNRDYIWTARAKGMASRAVTWRHAVRNALLPVVTVTGYSFGYVLSGSVLVETVFGWPGMGRLVFESVQSRDNSVVIGIFVIVALTVLIANLLTDIAYGFLDPRIRHGEAK